MNLMTAAVYADEITWQDNTENGRIEKNSTDEKPPAEVNDWGGDDFVAKEEPAAEIGEELPEKGGIYITESDRTTLLEKINQIASSTY